MRLSTDELRTLDRLLDEALDLPAEQRAHWLETLPAEHAALGPTLRGMLARIAAPETADLLERAPHLTTLFGARFESAAVSGLAAGTQVGPYRLMRELGAGGMGVVWLAERTDGILKRPVALKLPLMPVHQRALAERFSRERDILASLTHANIARLYDAGITVAGQPYLALEYVLGQPLGEYCDRHHLDVRSRIGLLIQVVRAVQYAHANLVVHRDLKPSNILVTDSGEVRLLDFGVAKLIGDGEPGESELTHIAGRAHTPSYASPEQISGAPVSIASDVYSLGVIGYELLTGSRPYRPSADGRAALEHAVLNSDPLRPSLAVTPEAAEQRGLVTERKLATLLEGDLDTILLKSLKKRPEDRYATADALAEDLERHLRGDAIDARADSRWYRLRKFARRNRVAVGATATIAVALVTGLSIALWQAQEARHEADRANAVQQFMLDLFRANEAGQPDPISARKATARELLDRGAQRIQTALETQPEARIELLDTLARLYAELGLWAEAGDLTEQQIALARSIYGDRDPRLAGMLTDLVRSLDMRSGASIERIPALLAEAERILDARGDQDSIPRAHLHQISAAYFLDNSLPNARRHAERSVAVFRAHQPDNPEFVTALTTLAIVELRQGELAAAQATISSAIVEARRLHLPEYRLAYVLYRAGEVNSFAGDANAAEENFRAALAMSERVNGSHHEATTRIRRSLARFLSSTSRRDEATKLALTILADINSLEGGRERYQEQDTRRQLFEIFRANGDLPRARALSDDAFAALGAVVPDSFENADLLLERTDVEMAMGELTRATASVDTARAMVKRIGIARGSLLYGNLVMEMARLSLVAGESERAYALLVEQKAYWPETNESLAASRADLNTELVIALIAMGRPEDAGRLGLDAEAEFERAAQRQYMLDSEADLQIAIGRAFLASADCRSALDHFDRGVLLFRQLHVPQSPWRANAEAYRALCLAQVGRLDEARSAIATARIAHAANAHLGAQFRAPLEQATALVIAGRRGEGRDATVR